MLFRSAIGAEYVRLLPFWCIKPEISAPSGSILENQGLLLQDRSLLLLLGQVFLELPFSATDGPCHYLLAQCAANLTAIAIISYFHCVFSFRITAVSGRAVKFIFEKVVVLGFLRRIVAI